MPKIALAPGKDARDSNRAMQHLPLLCAECRETKAASCFSRTQRFRNERRRCLRCIGQSKTVLPASGALSASRPGLAARGVTIPEPAHGGIPRTTFQPLHGSFKCSARDGGNGPGAQRWTKPPVQYNMKKKKI
jgi:hypothetical protein